MHIVDAVKVTKVSEAMETLRLALEDLHECECELVTVVKHHANGNNFMTMIVSKVQPEIAAPILWQALGEVQMIVRASQPPTNALN